MARAITPLPRAPPPTERTQPTPAQPAPPVRRATARRQSAMPVCRRIRATTAAMPISAMTTPGGPMTPSKHIQAKPGRRCHELQQER